MTIGLIGRKRGMTRVFSEDGVSTPVTVIEVEPNRVSQLKTVDTDGYNAIQVTVGERKASRVSKPQAGHFAKAQTAAGRKVAEFRTVEDIAELELGAEIKVDIFEAGQKIDVSQASPKVKALPVSLNVTASAVVMRHTVTHCLTELLALSVSVKHQVVYLKVKEWRVTWVINNAPCKTCQSFEGRR